MSVRVFTAILRRDLRLAWRRWPELAQPPLFLLLVASLFPLAVSPSREVLNTIAPGVIWVAALLAVLLALDLLFRPDLDDGSVDLMVLSPQPLALVAASRVLVHWLVTGVPLIIVTPLIGVMYALPSDVLNVIVQGLMLGTPLLSLVGGIGAALTVGLRRAAPLLALLVLPLYVPVLIFGTRAAALAAAGLDPSGALYLLAAMLVLGVTLAPLAIGAALRISVE